MASSLIWALLAILAMPLLLLIHELGHAAAVVLLTGRPARVVVGEGRRYAGLNVGRLRLRLFAGGEAGHCELPPEASPRDWFLISLAGPLASFLGALLAGVGLVRFGQPFMPLVSLALLTFGGAVMVVGNLLPATSGEDPTDGWCAREAWRRWHGTPNWRVPLFVVYEREWEASAARRVVAAATSEAERSGAAYVGSGHVLAALAGGEDHVGRALRHARVKASSLSAPGDGTRLRLSPSLRRSVERAAQEAGARGADYPSSEELLLAVLQEPESEARALLGRLGSSPSDVHRRLLEEKMGVVSSLG